MAFVVEDPRRVGRGPRLSYLSSDDPDAVEHVVRQAAFDFLRRAQTQQGDDVLPMTVLRQHVEVGGLSTPIAIFQRGIFKPRQLRGALSLTTAPPTGATPPYEDRLEGEEVLHYHYRGTDPQQADNRAVRYALEHRLPLVYLHGVVPGVYLPIYPVHVIGEDVRSAYFHVDLTGMALPEAISTASDRIERRYRTGVVAYRMHQARFREAVLRAYRRTCAICRLQRAELIDAAHILSDADGGQPVVSNGLALCKLHHAAFDRFVMGVTDDLRIVVRLDVLEQIDGPMLLHGLQGFHGLEITVPSRSADRPDRALLKERFERFLAAS